MATTITKDRLVDSGWRITIPKVLREDLGWMKDTKVCVKWDGEGIRIRNPVGCVNCPDVIRVGALGKVVIPPIVRKEAGIYHGQVLTLKVSQDGLVALPGDSQVRCQACGSELGVEEIMPNVHLCMRCRDTLEKAAVKFMNRKGQGENHK